MTIKEAMVAHQIKSDHTIRDWLREEKRKNADLRVSNSLKVPKNKDVKKPLGADLPKDVKALQRQLEEAQLRIAALNTLIDVAEEQLNIDIRKKPGARQF